MGTLKLISKSLQKSSGLNLWKCELVTSVVSCGLNSGELEAHCMGPKKVAYCELFDHHDGTFTLNIKPQEPGRHILQVKYGGEHVPGNIMDHLQGFSVSDFFNLRLYYAAMRI